MTHRQAARIEIVNVDTGEDTVCNARLTVLGGKRLPPAHPPYTFDKDNTHASRRIQKDNYMHTDKYAHLLHRHTSTQNACRTELTGTGLGQLDVTLRGVAVAATTANRKPLRR